MQLSTNIIIANWFVYKYSYMKGFSDEFHWSAREELNTFANAYQFSLLPLVTQVTSTDWQYNIHR